MHAMVQFVHTIVHLVHVTIKKLQVSGCTHTICVTKNLGDWNRRWYLQRFSVPFKNNSPQDHYTIESGVWI